MTKCIYLAHYDDENIRNASTAGVTVMNYMIRCIDKISKENIILSPLGIAGSRISKRTVKNISSNTKLIYTVNRKTYNRWNLIARLIFKLHSDIMLYKELKELLNDGDTLIVYHSVALMKIVQRIKKIKNINLVLQICEVYADAYKNSRLKKKEFKYFNIADRYIFQSELLNKLINKDNKSFTVLYGTYSMEYLSKIDIFHDEKIHCVYAGTLNKVKNGAYAAASIAEYLNDDYHIHILGVGNKNEVKEIKNYISNVSKIAKCKISLEGPYYGSDYIKFLQSCDISLCTQNPNEDFNNTSFPSKILVYMANGLRVVSVKIPAITESKINDYMYYCDEYTPQALAETIKKINFTDGYDSYGIMYRLNDIFEHELKHIILK